MGRKSHGTGYQKEPPFPRLVGPETYDREVREQAAIEANLAAAHLQHETVGHTAETPQERYDAARKCISLELQRHFINGTPVNERIEIEVDALAQAAHDLGFEEGYSRATNPDRLEAGR